MPKTTIIPSKTRTTPHIADGIQSGLPGEGAGDTDALGTGTVGSGRVGAATVGVGMDGEMVVRLGLEGVGNGRSASGESGRRCSHCAG